VERYISNLDFKSESDKLEFHQMINRFRIDSDDQIDEDIAEDD